MATLTIDAWTFNDQNGRTVGMWQITNDGCHIISSGVIRKRKDMLASLLRAAVKSVKRSEDDVTAIAVSEDKGQWTVQAPEAIRGRVIRTNNYTGMRTIAFPAHLIASIGRAQGKSESQVISQARNGRVNAQGDFTFVCGGGYDVLSADLLGGSADGKAYSDFQASTGISLTYA